VDAAIRIQVERVGAEQTVGLVARFATVGKPGSAVRAVEDGEVTAFEDPPARILLFPQIDIETISSSFAVSSLSGPYGVRKWPTSPRSALKRRN